MSRRIVPWPNPCLKAKAEPIVEITPEITQIWQDMIVVMEAMPGVGLAAPQLGMGLRLAVVDASSVRGQVLRMANPEILQVSAKLEVGERPALICRVYQPRSNARAVSRSAIWMRPAPCRKRIWLGFGRARCNIKWTI